MNLFIRTKTSRDVVITRIGSEPNISQTNCNSHSTLSLENVKEVKTDNDVMVCTHTSNFYKNHVLSIFLYLFIVFY